MSSPNWISAKEAAQKLGYAPEYVARLCRQGDLECKREYGAWSIREDSLASFAARVEQEQALRAKTLSRQFKKESKVQLAVPTMTVAVPPVRGALASWYGRTGRKALLIAVALFFAFAAPLGAYIQRTFMTPAVVPAETKIIVLGSTTPAAPSIITTTNTYPVTERIIERASASLDLSNFITYDFFNSQIERLQDAIADKSSGTGGGGITDFSSLTAGDIPDLSATYLKLTGGTLSGALALPSVSASATSSFAGVTLNMDCTGFGSGGVLTTDPSGNIICANDDTVGSTFAYPFPSNATTTQIAFNGGLTAVGATTTALAVTGSSTVSSVLNVGGVLNANGGVVGNLTGNASTATALQTGRTINGILFDGTANITITAASSTLLANDNTFSGINSFTGNTTLAAATSTSFAISSISSGSLLKTTTGGAIIAAIAGTDYLTAANVFAYPFPSNATTTILTFSAGFLSSTSTIGTLNATSSAILASTTLAGNTLMAQATTSSFGITSVLSALLKTTAGGSVVAAQPGIDYLTDAEVFDYLFPGNATTTQIAFNGGLTAVGATTTALAVTGSSTVSSVLNVGGVLNANGGVVGNLTGNASTATALQTGRTINGILFDGTANITINAASSTLLANDNTWSGTNTFSNPIIASITGNAATVTNGVYTTTFNSLFDARFITQLAATTSIASITTLPNLSLPYSQLTGTPSIAAYPFPNNATTTTLLFQGGLVSSASTTIVDGVASLQISASGGSLLDWNGYQLNLAGNSYLALGGASPYIESSDEDSLLQLRSNGASGGVAISAGGIEHLRVTGSGRVGIGTTSPYAKLSVVGQVVGEYFTATSSTASTFPYASTTMITATTASTTNLVVSGISAALLKTVGGVVTAAIAGTDYLTAANVFAYPFPSNATTTQIAFNGGATFVGATSTALAVTGSSTVSSVLNVGGQLNANASAVIASTTLTGNTLLTSATTTNLFVSGLASTTALRALNGTINYASTTMITATTASTTALIVSGLNSASCDVKADLSGVLSCGTDATGSGSTYPFTLTGNATSTLTQFNGGLTAYASSTIGNGVLGLTVSGNSTTTGTGYFAGSVGIGTSSPFAKLSISANSADTGITLFAVSSSTANSTSTLFAIDNTGIISLLNTPALSISTVNRNVSLGVTGAVSAVNAGGFDNTAIGNGAMSAITSGFGNTALGAAAGSLLTTGYRNTTIGTLAGFHVNTGNNNTLVGMSAGFSVTSGYSNTIVGDYMTAGNNITTGFGNLSLGSEAFLPSATANQQLNIGNILFGTLPATSSSFRLPTTGAIGIATSSPFATLAVHAVNSSANTTLFAIGSSTASATSTLFSVSNTGSTTLFQLNSALLKTNSSGTIVAAVAGADYATLTTVASAYPFAGTGNSTSTLTQFNAGLTAYASTTIGAGGQTTGLTISGGATTTGLFAVTGSGTSTFSGNVNVQGQLKIGTGSIYLNESSTSTYSAGISALSLNLSGYSVLGNATSTSFAISGISSGNLLKTTTGGAIIAAIAGTDYATLTTVASAYPFAGTGNATSTLTQFNAGLTAYASSTIGSGTATGGLTISGNSTTTGTAYFAGNVGIGTSNPAEKLVIQNDGDADFDLSVASNTQSPTIHIMHSFGTHASPSFVSSAAAIGEIKFETWDGSSLHGSSAGFGAYTDEAASSGSTPAYLSFSTTPSGSATYLERLRITSAGNVGIGTTSPFAKFSVHAYNGQTNTALFAIGSSTASATTTLFSVSNTGSTTIANGVNITAGCYAVSGTCLTTGGSLSGTQGQLAYFSGTNTAVGTSTLFVSTAGQVGIGTTSPFVTTGAAGLLDAVGSATTAYVASTFSGTRIRITNLDTTANNFSQLSFATNDANGTNATAAAMNAIFTSHSANAVTSDLAFTTKNAGTLGEVLRLTGAGNVGIGTTTPASLLTVGSFGSGLAQTNSALISSNNVQTLGLQGDSSAANINFYANATTTRFGAIKVGSAAAAGLGSGSGGFFNFYTTDATAALNLAMTISQSGSLGVGTTTPWARMSVDTSSLAASVPSFAVGSSSRTDFFVDQAGNVGIGTTTLIGKLVVNTGAGTTHANTVKLTRISSVDYSALSFDTGSTVNWSVGQNSTGNFGIFESGSAATTRFVVQPGGSVGVATTTPWALLSVNPNGITGPSFAIGSSTKTHFMVSNGGFVGIGTTSPTATLQIEHDDAVVRFFDIGAAMSASRPGWQAGPIAGDFAIGSFTNWTTAASAITSRLTVLGASGNIGVGSTTPGAKLSVTNPDVGVPSFIVEDDASPDATPFIIDSTGRVGVGTTTPLAGLDVYKDGANGTGIDSAFMATNPTTGCGGCTFIGGKFLAIGNAGNNSSTNIGLQVSASGATSLSNNIGMRVGIGPNSSDTTTSLVQFYDAGFNTLQGNIARNGAAAVAYNTTSDRRIKTGFASTTDGLDTLLRISVEEFAFKSDSSGAKVQGFIAQNLYKYYPEAVTTNGDNGTEPLGSSNPWQVDYGRVTPLIVRAVQELNSKLELRTLGFATTTSEELVSGPFTSATNALKQAIGSALATIGDIAQTGVRILGKAVYASVGIFDRVLTQTLTATTVYADQGTIKKLNTDELCVGAVCVTETEFLELINGAATFPPQSDEPDDLPVSPADDPVGTTTDPEPEPDPAPEATSPDAPDPDAMPASGPEEMSGSTGTI